MNLEINYASFCGVRTLIITGPQKDSIGKSGSKGLAQYARAIEEALNVGKNLSFVIQMPMYREASAKPVETLSSLTTLTATQAAASDADAFTAWDSWNQVRSICKYSLRLFVGKYLDYSR